MNLHRKTPTTKGARHEAAGLSVFEGRFYLSGYTDEDVIRMAVEDALAGVHDAAVWGENARHVRGVELIGVTQSSKLKVTEPYDAAKDIMFYARGDGDFITLRAGMFAVFGPQDAHMPSLAAKGSDIVRNVVVKVQWSD